jgi:hypothetical protein
MKNEILKQKKWLELNFEFVGNWIFVNGVWYQKEEYENWVLSSPLDDIINGYETKVMGAYPSAMNYLISIWKKDCKRQPSKRKIFKSNNKK